MTCIISETSANSSVALLSTVVVVVLASELWLTAPVAGTIAEIAEIECLERIRYTTSYPADMDESLIAAHRDVPELMPFLHLPVSLLPKFPSLADYR